jgi:hypothetical protein
MWKLLALLATVCLAACGSASTAAPKTTNPPVVAEPPAPPADESWRLTFDQLGVQVTIPNHRWIAQEHVGDDGNKYVKMDLEGTSLSVFMKPYLNPNGTPLKMLAEQDRRQFVGDSSMTVSEVEDDGDGRWAFIVDAQGGDGTLRGKMYIVPSQVRSDGYFSMAVIGLVSDYDQHVEEAHGIIKSLKPLPK